MLCNLASRAKQTWNNTSTVVVCIPFLSEFGTKLNLKEKKGKRINNKYLYRSFFLFGNEDEQMIVTRDVRVVCEIRGMLIHEAVLSSGFVKSDMSYLLQRNIFRE